MDDFDVARTVLLWLWAFGLGCIEIEIEGGHGWAERLPTWYLRRGKLGRAYAVVMGQRPLTGYHVFAFTIPLVILHLPFGFGLDWSWSAELSQLGIFFALAVIWDYIWFVNNPAYTVRRFRRENVWWFQVPWIWRFPLDYYTGIGVSIALAGVAALGGRRLVAAGQPPVAPRGTVRPDRARGPGCPPLPPLVPPHAPSRCRRPRGHRDVRTARPGRGLDRRHARPASARRAQA